METLALCPFTVGTLVWQPQPGVFTLTAIVKATFRLVPGSEVLLTDEQEMLGGDRYYDDDPSATLLEPTDFVPYKPRTDVLIVGHAYPPEGRPMDALVARVTVGDWTKAIGIVGDRVWVEGADGLEPSPPKGFTRMPLRYERASRTPFNPVGLDLAATPVAGAIALPNLEAVDDERAQERTVGFGPIAPKWRGRRSLLNGPGLVWVNEHEHGPLPRGFDFAYFNAAPPDQQLALLRPGEQLVLEHLNPEHARLETRLPPMRPKAFAIDQSERATEIALRCDTIWIDTDRATMVTLWRGLTDVDSEAADSVKTLVVLTESKGNEVRARQVEQMLRERAGSITTAPAKLPDPLARRHDALRDDAPAPPTVPERARPAVTDEDSAGTETETQRLRHTPAPRRDDAAPPLDMAGTETDMSITDPVPESRGIRELSLQEYARLAVAIERGDVDRALAAHTLDRAALARVQAQWRDRAAADPALAATLAEAIEAARWE